MAMTLADIRSKYPAYKDVDDQTLADAIYKKHYPTADRREFDARIGLNPYDNALETMGKALQGTPGNIGLGISGIKQMASEGAAGDPNALLDRMGQPGFKLSERPEIDETNLIQWGRKQIGLDSSTPLTPEQRTQIEALAQSPAGKTSFQQYVSSPDAIGTSPENVAKASLTGQLERQQIDKSIPDIDAKPGSPEELAANVTSSIAQMAPGYAASILLRNPLPTVALAQTLTSGQAYADARKAGLDSSKAAEYAVTSGFAEAVGEALPLGIILKEGGGKILPKLFKAGISEAAQESVTQFIQSMLASGSITPDMTWSQVKDQVITAAVTGAVAGGLMTGAMAGVESIGNKKAPTAEEVSAEVFAEPAANEQEDVATEDMLALPAPNIPLALPSPDAYAVPNTERRQPAAPAVQPRLPDSASDMRTTDDGKIQIRYGTTGAWHDGVMHADGTITSPGADQDMANDQARIALQRTKQAETADLLKTARETIKPLGTFSSTEIGGPAAQKVALWRQRTGRPLDTPVSIEDMARAKVPQSQIDAAISARRPMTEGQVLSPKDVIAAAEARNIIANDGNFKELAYRSTGSRDVSRMTQAQLQALKSTVEAMPVHEKPVTIPVTDSSPFTEGQYNKAIDALRNQGRFTLKAIKDATGLKADTDAHAVRDAMVRRGQLVQRGKGDFRLYDVTGAERQAVPEDLPKGAFSEHVVKRLPVSRVSIKQNGKSIGNFGSASEAREKIRELRAKEAEGGKASQIELSHGDEVAYGVMENRYDENGNLLGQVVVDTARDEAAARKLADERNSPTAPPQFETVTPSAPPRLDATPTRQRKAPPSALAGRMDEVLGSLNKIATTRGLPLLGTKVGVRETVLAPDGTPVEGMYVRNLITLSAANLTPGMSTAEITDKLAQIMDHETIHALRQAGVLAPGSDGWKTIVNYARKTKRPASAETYMEWAERNYKGLPGYEDPTARQEEAIAETFRAWAANKRNVVGKPASVFRQIVEWFKRLLSSIPNDVFAAIETGDMVREALTPPGAAQPRARTAVEMEKARKEVAAAQAAQDENAVRVQSRAFLRARAQGREDRYGRSGPKTVLGTTPGKAYDSGERMDADRVAALVDRFKEKNAVGATGLATYLPEDQTYLQRVADAQQKGVHNPEALDVAKAYRALIDETKAMFDALDVKVVPWAGEGAPYDSPAAMLDDIENGTITMRLSDDMFGPGADNPGHPLNAPSGRVASDGTPLTNNDLFRVVHDVYGRGQIGFRSSARDDYNAYHEHARLLSPEARKALATETLAQSAWHHYGPHLRRRDGTVPKKTDVDYLAPSRKEFAEQKAFLLPGAVIEADPGWALADEAAAAADGANVQTDEAAPKFSVFKDDLPGGRLYGNPNRSPGGAVSAPGTPSPAFTSERDGNKFFGGEMADEQLRMATQGTDGATLIYLSPDEFLAIANQQANPEQDVYDALSTAGYKFSTMPSLVLDGYAGNVRVHDSDGAFAARALGDKAELIPVTIYPKRGENMGLVTAIEANGVKLPWPALGRQDNFVDVRQPEPTFDLKSAYGTRAPRFSLGEESDLDRNIVEQRVEGYVGKALHSLGRSKRELPLPKLIKGMVGDSIFDARIKLQDRMLSVKEMLENIKTMDGTISDATNTYMVEQLAGSRTVHQIEHRERELYEPLFDALRKANTGSTPISTKEFEDFLYARHAPERNTYLRARGAKTPNPSGMSDAEASSILDGFALAGKLPQLDSLAAIADKISKDTTQTRLEAGLISQKAADGSPYEFYIPLRGKNEEDLDPEDVYDPQTRARSGKGYTVGGKEDRSTTGRARKAGDLIGHLILQNTESVIRSEKNRVALSFMRLLRENPNTGYGTILSSAPTRAVVGANGMIREAGDPSYRQRPDIFTAKYKGAEIVAQVNDPRVARAMKADYVTQSGGLVNFLGRVNRYLATVNTSWNPEFLISNMARDLQTAGLLGAQYDIKGLSTKIVGNAGRAMNGIHAMQREGTFDRKVATTIQKVWGGGKDTEKWYRAFQELQDAGGTTEFLGLHDLDTHVQRLRADAARTGLNTTMRQAREHVQNIGKFIDDYNKTAENAFRLSAYVAAREVGISVDKAAFLAKNLTVNFNKGGENKAVMNAYYLFYNASISGTFVLLNGLKSKKVQKLVAGIVIAGFAQDILNRVMSGDDDDNGVPDYDDIPDYVLENNWVFMLPNSKTYVALPMPYGFNVFHNLGRNISNAFSGSPVHNPGKSAMSTAMTALSAFNPMGGSQNVFNFIAPTIADPIVDLLSNKDFAGNDIVPERPSFGVPVPDSQKYWSNTGEIPKAIAEQINNLTGGNEQRSGGMDVSPEVLQYWFDYATGAVGKFVTRNAEAGGKVLSGDLENIEIGDIPFARRVVGSVTNRGNTERYYETAKEVKTVAAELKAAREAGNRDQFQAILARSAPAARLIKTFEDGEKKLSTMRKQIRELRANDKVPADRKKAAIKELQEQQDDLMERLNLVYFEQMKR